MSKTALGLAALAAAGMVCVSHPPLAHADNIPGLDPFVGEWRAHEEKLVVYTDGTGVEYALGGSIAFRLVDVRHDADGTIAEGNVTTASVSHAQRGSIVELQLTDGGRGLLVGIGGADSGFPFCKMVNGAAANPMDCGA